MDCDYIVYLLLRIMCLVRKYFNNEVGMVGCLFKESVV